jgi:hypothetical protein
VESEEEEAGSENDPNQEDEEEIEVSDDEDEGSESQDSKAESTDTVPAEDGDLDRFFRAHTNPFATDDGLPEKSRKNPLDDENPSDGNGGTIQEEEDLKTIQEESTSDPNSMSDQIDALQKKIWQAKKELTAKNFG